MSLIESIVSLLHPGLLPKDPYWRRANRRNPLAGHCYVASESLFWLSGGRRSGLVPQVMRVGGRTHWFLKDRAGRIIDPTASQFKRTPSYRKARGCGFLTARPSRRAQEIIDRIGAVHEG